MPRFATTAVLWYPGSRCAGKHTAEYPLLISRLLRNPEWTITISPRYTVEHGDFAVANCGVILCVIGKLISRWTTMIAVDHRGLGGSL
ncbi:hypothetical protein DPMN_036922 [Dreissena polymorpha]|uniref:Uncharacterized protein n=1 Tax=Dreissena polymorpha TaxID=45954 RepID=A0A9D4MCH4_DREPO|nr:hypothetical protein DPMN_036922 [Dreissena polymorpha]